MRRILFTAFALALSLIECAAQNSFAVFVDETTWKNCSAEIEMYKKVLDAEDLKTTIYHADWTSPEQVRNLIRKQAKSKRPLEGCVFIGDVPIVMVRQGQHMTTAFKMDEDTYPINESSVASDRFYDDFDLDFEFLQRDTIDATRYYYRLTDKGAQTLRPEIYSARIRVPKFMADSQDKYELIRKYLRKTVAAHQESNILDNLTFFFGSGYYSDDMNVWREKSVAYEECFPHTLGKASQRRFLNFHQKDEMKWTLFSELQRKGIDVFQFSEHGAPETQYINGEIESKSLDDYLNDLRHSVLAADADEDGLPDYLAELKKHFADSTLTAENLAKFETADSLRDRNKDIFQEDIAAIRSNPRLVILNACYNGSFHDPEGYIAGAHIFSDGDCVVAQGNTVNALQDKIEDKLIGLLSLGMRVGLWEKEVPYLENHLIGDPTYRFTPVASEKALSDELYTALVRKPLDTKVWRGYLNHSNPIVRSTAIVHLGYAGDTSSALDMMKNDPSAMVRMSAFSAIFSNPSDNIEDAIMVAIRDPYELIVRNATKVAEHYAYAGRNNRVLDACKDLKAKHPEMVREAYYLGSVFSIIDHEGYYAETLEVISDKEARIKSRISGIRLLRNNNFIPAIPVLTRIIADNSEDTRLREIAAEALGWYTLSYARKDLVKNLEGILKDSGTMPASVAAEVRKTIKRLEFK